MDNDNTHSEDKSTIVEVPKKNILKENWLKEDICCEKCGQVVERQKGITKQNIKRLFSFKFSLDEVIWTLVIIMVLISAFAYQNDTKICREYVEQVKSGVINVTSLNNPPSQDIPFPQFNFTTITTNST